MENQEFQKLLQIPGQANGAVFQTDIEFIKYHKGEEGLSLIQTKAAELGLEIPYEKSNISTWHPVGLRAISLLIIKDVFNFSDHDIRQMGVFAPKFSATLKISLKFLISIKSFIDKTPWFWEKNYSVGKLEVLELDEEKKILKMALHNFKIHPILNPYFEGYFERTFQLMEPSATGKLTKSIYKGDEYDEFTYTWT